MFSGFVTALNYQVNRLVSNGGYKANYSLMIFSGFYVFFLVSSGLLFLVLSGFFLVCLCFSCFISVFSCDFLFCSCSRKKVIYDNI